MLRAEISFGLSSDNYFVGTSPEAVGEVFGVAGAAVVLSSVIAEVDLALTVDEPPPSSTFESMYFMPHHVMPSTTIKTTQAMSHRSICRLREWSRGCLEVCSEQRQLSLPPERSQLTVFCSSSLPSLRLLSLSSSSVDSSSESPARLILRRPGCSRKVVAAEECIRPFSSSLKLVNATIKVHAMEKKRDERTEARLPKSEDPREVPG